MSPNKKSSVKPWRARKENGAGHGVRTRDIQLGKLDGSAYKPLSINDLQGSENPVTPQVTPETPKDAKMVLLEALQGVDRATLLEVIADLVNKQDGK